MKKRITILCILLIFLMMSLGACSSQTQSEQSNNVDFNTLICTGSVELQYATQFTIDKYGEYRMITIVNDGRFLLIPEDMPVPENLPEDVAILQQPLDRIYLVSTSVMDLIRELDGLEQIRLSGTKEQDWHIEEAVTAMEAGNLLYAGKYNEPDYELILTEGCNLAIENTMIYHNPEVKEKLNELGIPVLVEQSSYEEHPLGRLEWIKLYGLLLGKEEEANAFYDTQLALIEPVMEKEDCDLTVAFFYVTANGTVNVRKPNDYISQMIQLAGGQYIFSSLQGESENALSTMNLQMENFYATAKNADILIYNSTIEGELSCVDDLLAINPLFGDFKAVQEGRVYCTNSDFFQKSTGICSFIEDLSLVFTDVENEQFTFLIRLR